MAPAALQLTVMAAEELKNVATFGKMDLYTVAWVDPYLRRATRVLRKAGKNPVWNDTLTLSLETTRHCPNALLTIQIYSESSMGDKVVGTGRLPLQEIFRISPTVEGEEPVVVTLQLQRPSGRVQGVVSLSMRVTGDVLLALPAAQPSAPGFKYGEEDLVMGIPVPPFAGGPYYENNNGFGTTSTGYPTLPSTETRGAGGSGMIPYAYPPPSPPSYQFQPGYYPGQAPTSYPSRPFSYVQPPQPQSRSSSGLLLGLLGGALGGLILGDILS